MVKSFYTNIINPNLGTDSPSSNVTNPMGATLDMGGNYIINTAQANQSNGVPTLSQVQALITAGGGGGGGGWVPTATSDLNMNSHSITNLASVILVGTEESNQLLMDTGLLSVTRDGGATYGYIYDSRYNTPSGNLDGLTIVNGDLEYNDAIVLTTEPVTTSIGTLSCTTSFSANTLLPPYSNYPPINATTCTLSANMTYNSGNLSFISTNGQSTAFSNFAVGNGSIISCTKFTNTIVSSVQGILGFCTANPTAGQPPVLMYEAAVVPDPNNPQLLLGIVYANLQNELAFIYTTRIVTLDNAISVVYANNIFQVLVDGVIEQMCNSNNPLFANMPLSQTSNLSLFGMFGCSQGLSMSRPSMGLYGGYLLPPMSSRSFTMFSGASSIVPVKTYSYLINLAIPINISSSVIPLNGNDPSTTSRLDIYILDSNNHSVIDNNPCWTFVFQNANQYMTWDAVAGLLRFNYQSNAASPVVGNSNIVENFYNMPWTTVSFEPPFRYYYQFSLTQPYLMGTTGLSFSTTITDTNINVFRYPLCSQTDGVNTQIKIGNHQEPLLSLKLSDSTLKCGNDTIITTANISNYGAITGLRIDPANNLLQFNDQPLMINQYSVPKTPITMTSTIAANTQLNNTIVGTGTISGNYEDLFNNLDGYSFNVVMTTSEISTHYPPFLPNQQPVSSKNLSINITDSLGVSILANPYTGQPCFYFQDILGNYFKYTTITATSATLTFNTTIYDSSVPIGNDKYFIYTQGLRPNLVGPFTVTYSMFSYYNLGNDPMNGNPIAGFSTINSVTNCTFGFIGADTTNPYPVVSNYNGSNNITTIRTGQNAPVIQTYQASGLGGGGMNICTDSLQLIPTNATTSKSCRGVKSGTLSSLKSGTISINIQPLPTTIFSFTYTLFVWFNYEQFTTIQTSGVIDPVTLKVLGLTQSTINIAGVTTNGVVGTTLYQGGLQITTVTVAQFSNIPYYYTLTYDFICI